MKNIIGKIVLTCSLVIFLTAITTQRADSQVGARVSFQVFYDNLAPYGDWIQDPSYGYVWVPSVGRGFRPYSSSGYCADTPTLRHSPEAL